MNLSNFHIAFFTIVFLLPLTPVSEYEQGISISPNFYEEGLIQKNKGNFEKALKIWSEGKMELENPDFRIGQSFIELVTARQLDDYYENASEMYFWGLGNQQIESMKLQLIREVELIEPMLGFRTFKKLKNKAEGADASLLKDLRGFWEKNDPTPLSSYNERLIEHWLRVQHAKQNYANSKSNEIDDRGKLYIRYGKPDVSRQGQFNYNSGTINYLLDQQMSGRLNPFEREENFTSSAMKTLQFNLESRIRGLHQYPQYEVWVFDNLMNEPDGAVFVFGTSDGRVYKKKNSVEDFIPAAAFNTVNLTEQSLLVTQQSFSATANDNNQSALSVNTSGGSQQVPDINITPALIMQLMYYQQLSAIDTYFGDAYEEMLDRYLELSSRISSSLARQFENTNIGELVRLQGRIPRQISTEKNEIASIAVKSYIYNFITNKNEPFSKIFVLNNFDKIANYDFLKNNNSLNIQWSEYKIITGVRILNEDYGVEHLQRKTINLGDKNNGALTTIFDVSIGIENERVEAATEFIKKDGTSSNNSAIYNNAIVGMGKTSVELSESLPSNELAMSDIIVGFGNKSRRGQLWLPFKIAHDHLIPQGNSMKLYYEVYHLSKNSSGRANFNFTYKIRSTDNGFLRLFNQNNSEDQISITFNNETNDDRFSNILEIEAGAREKGTYKLIIILKDLESEMEIEKTIPFEII